MFCWHGVREATQNTWIERVAREMMQVMLAVCNKSRYNVTTAFFSFPSRKVSVQDQTVYTTEADLRGHHIVNTTTAHAQLPRWIRIVDSKSRFLKRQGFSYLTIVLYTGNATFQAVPGGFFPPLVTACLSVCLSHSVVKKESSAKTWKSPSCSHTSVLHFLILIKTN